MRFAPQEPIYLHHRLRGQLTQHLKENGVEERSIHAGSLKGMKFEGMKFEDPGEQPRGPGSRERVPAVPLPHLVTLGPLQSEDLAVGDLTGLFSVGQ